MVGNIVRVQRTDVPPRCQAEVLLVRPSSIFVDVASENDLVPQVRRRDVKAADPAEKVSAVPTVSTAPRNDGGIASIPIH